MPQFEMRLIKTVNSVRVIYNVNFIPSIPEIICKDVWLNQKKFLTGQILFF